MESERLTSDQVIVEIIKWSETKNGQECINKTYLELEDASRKIKEETSLKPEKLKMVIGI